MIFEYDIAVVPVSTLKKFLNNVEKTGWTPWSMSYVPPGAISKSKIQTGRKEDVAIVERILIGLKRLKKAAPEPKDS